MIDFGAGRAGRGDLDVVWHAGWPSAKHDLAPEIQVHAYDEHTFLLRQNKSVHYEAPFLFLFLGNDGAMLVDTGATADPNYFPLRRTVDDLLAGWLARHPRPGHHLTVTHTHAHGDHTAADGQFRGRPDTTVVGTGLEDVVTHYGLAGWPEGMATVDLGGRVLDVVPGPGHQAAALVFFDRYTGLLLTGDTFYPGRLYVEDWAAYVATIDRVLAFCVGREVAHVLGCHIEMTTTPDEDHRLGATYHPDEPPLQMTVGQLRALRGRLDEVAAQPGVHPFGDISAHPLGDVIVYRVG